MHLQQWSAPTLFLVFCLKLNSSSNKNTYPSFSSFYQLLTFKGIISDPRHSYLCHLKVLKKNKGCFYKDSIKTKVYSKQFTHLCAGFFCRYKFTCMTSLAFVVLSAVFNISSWISVFRAEVVNNELFHRGRRTSLMWFFVCLFWGIL